MSHPAFRPIRNTALPHGFHYIRLELARDHAHPFGDNRTAYIMIAPLDGDSRLDAEAWRENREACRIMRKRPNAEDSLGHLVHGPGGSWRFYYDVAGTTADEAGHHFSAERFEPGEYVSVHEAKGTRPYRVAVALPL